MKMCLLVDSFYNLLRLGVICCLIYFVIHFFPVKVIHLTILSIDRKWVSKRGNDQLLIIYMYILLCVCGWVGGGERERGMHLACVCYIPSPCIVKEHSAFDRNLLTVVTSQGCKNEAVMKGDISFKRQVFVLVLIRYNIGLRSLVNLYCMAYKPPLVST